MNCKHIKECKNADCRNFCGDDNLLGECDNFMRDTSKPLTQSENTPENGASEERVNENEPKNIDSSENKEVSRRDKIASVQAYCISATCSACVIREICDGGWSRNGHINVAYELIKDTPHMSVPGMAASATHYQILQQQPIEIMQKLMTPEEFRGFLLGNVIKYSLRFGHKDDIKSEAGKIAQYGKWLQQAVNGEVIKP